MSLHPRRTRAFTLIELLVVVAIIALLISILLPTLSRAKEQARISLDLANQRNIVQAGIQYCMDKQRPVFAFPWDFDPHHPGQPSPSIELATEFIWGGGVPDRRSVDWDPEMGDNPMDRNTDVYIICPLYRPMNKYLDANVSWHHDDRWGVNRQQRRNIPMELPDYFKCPSDSSAAVPMAGASDNPNFDPQSISRTWEFWGTSFAINWYWAYFIDPNGSFVGYEANGGGILNAYAKWMINQKTNKGAAEWIFFYENQMNFAMEGAWPRGYNDSTQAKRHLTGWHKQEDYYAAAFYDGHAEYRYFDTSYIDGAGWTTWPNRDLWENSDIWREYIDN